MYRVGFPGWRLVGRLGIPLFVKVEVAHDAEADVYIATSPDLPGLIAESATRDGLFHDVYDCLDMLMQEHLKRRPKARPYAAWTGEMSPA